MVGNQILSTKYIAIKSIQIGMCNRYWHDMIHCFHRVSKCLMQASTRQMLWQQYRQVQRFERAGLVLMLQEAEPSPSAPYKIIYISHFGVSPGIKVVIHNRTFAPKYGNTCWVMCVCDSWGTNSWTFYSADGISFAWCSQASAQVVSYFMILS